MLKLEYHWDGELLDALLLYRDEQIVRALLKKAKRERKMGTPADLAKLVNNMNRASTLIDKAAADAANGATIMDRFEARLGLNREYMAKIDAYEKQLAAMDQVGNGGPALDATFSSTAASSASSVASPSVVPPPIHHDTGDPIKA